MKKQEVQLDGKKILVTGAAGFIGAAVAERLLRDTNGSTVVGLDDLNPYYDRSLKEHRLHRLDACSEGSGSRWIFRKASVADRETLNGLFEEIGFDAVVHLAAQAGVRYSIEEPDVYVTSNVIGFYNILEACRHHPVEHLVFASSSSVYGSSRRVPFSVRDRADAPVSLYAATKKSDELFAHAYAKLYDIPTTALRFFTVYGPEGRPDMFYFTAAEALADGGTVRLFNYGDCSRDYTYIDDIVEGVCRVLQRAPARRKGGDGLPVPPYAVYNIGSGRPADLRTFIGILYEELQKQGLLAEDCVLEDRLELTAMQPGDVPVTYADCRELKRDVGYAPETELREGIRRFAEWFAGYRGSRRQNGRPGGGTDLPAGPEGEVNG